MKSRLRHVDAKAGSSALSDEVLQDARRGFERYLAAKGFPRRFIEENSEDLMARARLELAGAIERGTRINNPPGWLITCAYRRAQNLVTSKERAPDSVALDSVSEVIGDEETPEESALERDRRRKIQEAVAKLTMEERKLVALEFFEQLSLAKCARELGWDESKARRRHETAMEHLHDFLGVDSSDQIMIEVGFLAWISVAFGSGVGVNLPTGVDALADRAGHTADSAWARLHELARRLLSGGAGEPASAAAAGNATRALGACTAAVACLYAGAAGLGLVPGPSLGGSGHSNGSRAAQHSAPAEPGAQSTSISSKASGAKSAGGSSADGRRAGSTGANSATPKLKEGAAAHPSQPSVKEGEVEAEHVFHSFDGAGSSGSSPSSAGSGTAVKSAESTRGSSPAEAQAANTFHSFER